MQNRNDKVNRFGSRIKGSKGPLRKVLSAPMGRSETTRLREEFAYHASGSDRDAAEGYSQLYVHRVPIKKSVPSNAVWNAIDHDYWLLNSFEPGALPHFFLLVHQLGFRIFPKAAAAQSFKAKAAIAAYDTAFTISLSNLDMDIITDGSIDSLINAITSQVRGKGDKCTIEVLTQRMCLWLTGKVPSQVSGKDANFDELVNQLSQSLLDTFDTWRSLNSDVNGALDAISPVLQSYSIDTSPLFKAYLEIEQLADATDPDFKFSTVVYSGSEDLSELNPADTLMALCARYAHEGIQSGANPTKYAQECITTDKGKGLSWLFSKGLALLKAGDAKKLSSGFAVPNDTESQNRLKRLMAAASALKLPTMLTGYSHKDYRSKLQGSVDSFCANHLNRLKAWTGSVQSEIPYDQIVDLWGVVPEKEKDITGALTTATALLNTLKQDLPQFTTAVDVLSGESTFSDSDSFLKHKGQLESFIGKVAFINSSLERVKGYAKRKSLDLPSVELPAYWKDSIGLPRLAPTMSSIEQDRAELTISNQRMVESFNRLMAEIVENYRPTYDKAILNREAFFVDVCSETKKSAISDPKIVASREILSRLFSVLQRGSANLQSEALKILKKSSIWPEDKADQRTITECIRDKKHYVHVHPLDQKPKKLVRFNQTGFDEFNALTFIDALRQGEGLSDSDINNLRLCESSIQLLGLPESIDRSVFHDINESQLPPDLRGALSNPVVDRSTATRIIQSALKSALSGQRFRLNKTKFNHTLSFSHLEGNAVRYIPKDKDWKVPLHRIEGRFAPCFASNLIVWKDDGIVDSAQTALKIADGIKNISESSRGLWLAFLRELPHTFGVATGITGFGEEMTSLSIDKGVVSKKKERVSEIAIARDNQKLKTALDSMFESGKLSPPLVQLCRSFVIQNNEVVEQKHKRRVNVNIPIASTTDASIGTWAPSYLLGIDPGAYGLGLALTDIKGNVIDSGFIHINGLIEYAKAKSNHEKVNMPKQQYRSPYSNHLSNLLKGAVGEVTHVIDHLVCELNAMPVFEAIGGNREPWEQVFNHVIERYCYGDNDSQNAVRINHWRGAKMFKTELLRIAPGEKKAKPMNAFPGVRVSSYGNSQLCPACERNAIETVRQHGSEMTNVSIKNSKLELPNGTIKLTQPDPASAVTRRLKQQAPLRVDVADRTFKSLKGKEGKELQVMIKRSQRQAPERTHGKQGIESVFHCVYTSCNHVQNAEEVAAINTAKKLAGQLVDSES